MTIQHFITLDDLPQSTLSNLIERAIELKALTKSGAIYEPLKNKSLAMIFSKSSTRTRVSFEVGMRQLGGGTLNLSPNDTQIGRGEPLEDTARVISSMVDGVMIRTDEHQKLTTFADFSSVPVINGLTDDFHPCQLLADIQTFVELRGAIQGATIAWVGDGNNVCNSFMNAARIFDFTLNVATPVDYRPNQTLVDCNQSNVHLFDCARTAVTGADVVVTDTWASMGQENEKDSRSAAFSGFCVDSDLMALADKDALFMHCLPAYRGMEVSNQVIEGKQSVVFQEAENRLHAQKALLEHLLA
ncbi:ornithine carbamoyltransferase [Arenicella sp. 4NH20-0111]|uniref:ornithine carbamoyltransferase n=1 Tax=Arenicella sp. 4NH20-0111 TaxID=3127648 RepID=UPI00310BE27F